MSTESLLPLIHSNGHERGHICAFFHSQDEEFRALLPFIKKGFEANDRAFHIVDPQRRQEHLLRLSRAGIDVEAVSKRSQLVVKGWDETYLRDGHFNQEDMLNLIQEVLSAGHARGFKATRLIAHMEWGIEDRPGVDDLVEYESRLDHILPNYPDPVICVYDCSKFGAGVVMDVLRTHPAVIIGGALQKNPFFVGPDEFLHEIKSRKDSRAGLGRAALPDHQDLLGVVRDVLALTAVPITWVGPKPEQTAIRVAETLVSAFRPASVYVCLSRPGEASAEVSLAVELPEFRDWLESHKAQFHAIQGVPTQQVVEFPTSQGPLRALSNPIGIESEGGMIVVAALRPAFPTDVEMLLLSVVANQLFIWFQTAQALHESQRTEQVVTVLRDEIERTAMFGDIVGSSPALQTVLTRIAKVAPTDSTVLIVGETGTGKELIARAIHKRSHRAQRPFISVNCAAVPPTLIASELFGHEKGAFTGAQQRRLGRFELAEGGTIFLDEIGDVPPETQLALLRVLQEHEFERVGGSHAIAVNVRVIAATNRNLLEAIAAGTFREDLYYRLNVFPIEVPPLRERREDIPTLVAHFLNIYAAKIGKKFKSVDPRTYELLKSYSWPGNIRELQNVIERFVILCEGQTFSVDGSWLPKELPERATGRLADQLLNREREMIETALKDSQGRVAGPRGAAVRLGLPASTLEAKIKSLKLNKHRFRRASPL